MPFYNLHGQHKFAYFGYSGSYLFLKFLIGYKLDFHISFPLSKHLKLDHHSMARNGRTFTHINQLVWLANHASEFNKSASLITEKRVESGEVDRLLGSFFIT